jgi:hypothetical protein
MDGQRVDLPSCWTGAGETTFCLSCSRALAGEAAIESAPADTSREDLARVRRRALVEFEIRRSPDAPNRTIAQSCRTSAMAVAAIRKTLMAPAAGLVPLGPANGG